MISPQEYPDVVMLAVPAFIGLAIVEILAVRLLHHEGDYETRDTAASLVMGLGNFGTRFVGFGVTAALMVLAYQHRLFDIGHSWWEVLIGVTVYDLVYYWKHRLSHEIRWLWACHVVHHSSQHYNLSTALRQPWTGDLTGLVLLNVSLAFIGFHPAMIAFAAGVDLIYQFWIHTEVVKRFPRWFEWIFNTPSHHRVHHGKNARYLDANYGGILIIWDRIFGSFVPEQEEERVEYGIVHDLDTFNPLRISFHEYVSIMRDVLQPGLTLRQRLAYIVAPPGWSHDGSRQMVRELKTEYVRRHPEAIDAPGFREFVEPLPDPAE